MQKNDFSLKNSRNRHKQYSILIMKILNKEYFMYKCTVCDYEYDGSAEEFEALGDDYACPVCGVGKDMFELV